jgi:hypothetical protein
LRVDGAIAIAPYDGRVYRVGRTIGRARWQGEHNDRANTQVRPYEQSSGQSKASAMPAFMSMAANSGPVTLRRLLFQCFRPVVPVLYL